MSFDQIVRILEAIWHYLEIILVLAFFVVGIWVAIHHVKEMLADYIERLRDQERRYRVRTTIVKDMMDEGHTQTAKLRRLRVSKRTDKLILDPWPTIIPEDNDEARPATLTHFYSVPGRLGIQEDPSIQLEKKKFVLILGRDEELKKHKEYSTLLVYTLGEELDEILTPPSFVAMQPVGKECFTYEVHFPAARKFVRKNNGNPSNGQEPGIKVYRGVKDKEHELPYEPYGVKGNRSILRKLSRLTNSFRTRYHVIGGRADFGDGHGYHDWFRVTVLKPPQRENIHICWCMQTDPTRWGWCSHTEEEHKRV